MSLDIHYWYFTLQGKNLGHLSAVWRVSNKHKDIEKIRVILKKYPHLIVETIKSFEKRSDVVLDRTISVNQLTHSRGEEIEEIIVTLSLWPTIPINELDVIKNMMGIGNCGRKKGELRKSIDDQKHEKVNEPDIQHQIKFIKKDNYESFHSSQSLKLSQRAFDKSALLDEINNLQLEKQAILLDQKDWIDKEYIQQLIVSKTQEKLAEIDTQIQLKKIAVAKLEQEIFQFEISLGKNPDETIMLPTSESEQAHYIDEINFLIAMGKLTQNIQYQFLNRNCATIVLDCVLKSISTKTSKAIIAKLNESESFFTKPIINYPAEVAKWAKKLQTYLLLLNTKLQRPAHGYVNIIGNNRQSIFSKEKLEKINDRDVMVRNTLKENIKLVLINFLNQLKLNERKNKNQFDRITALRAELSCGITDIKKFMRMLAVYGYLAESSHERDEVDMIRKIIKSTAKCMHKDELNEYLDQVELVIKNKPQQELDLDCVWIETEATRNYEANKFMIKTLNRMIRESTAVFRKH